MNNSVAGGSKLLIGEILRKKVFQRVRHINFVADGMHSNHQYVEVVVNSKAGQL